MIRTAESLAALSGVELSEAVARCIFKRVFDRTQYDSWVRVKRYRDVVYIDNGGISWAHTKESGASVVPFRPDIDPRHAAEVRRWALEHKLCAVIGMRIGEIGAFSWLDDNDGATICHAHGTDENRATCYVLILAAQALSGAGQ